MLVVEFQVHILFFVTLLISPSPVLDILLTWDSTAKEKKQTNKQTRKQGICVFEE